MTEEGGLAVGQTYKETERIRETAEDRRRREVIRLVHAEGRCVAPYVGVCLSPWLHNLFAENDDLRRALNEKVQDDIDEQEKPSQRLDRETLADIASHP